jgi:hypothetical protein
MIVIDNFIKDNNLLLKIESDSNFFPESIGAGGYTGKFMFWDGWWKSPANTTRKKIVQKIWENNLPLNHDDICGFEYWTRTYNVGEYIGIHFDEDGFLYRDKKIFKGTTIGCVYYPHTNINVVGGFLEIHPSVIKDETPDALENDNINALVAPIEERERIACKPNRLVIFDGGHTLHNTTPIISGSKTILGINVWHKDNPPHALSMGKFYFE